MSTPELNEGGWTSGDRSSSARLDADGGVRWELKRFLVLPGDEATEVVDASDRHLLAKKLRERGARADRLPART